MKLTIVLVGVPALTCRRQAGGFGRDSG